MDHTTSAPSELAAPADQAFDHWAWRRCQARATGLTLTETRLLNLLATYADYTTGGGIFPSTATLAKALNMDPANLRGTNRGLGALVKKGWLKLTEKGPRSPRL